MSENQSLWGGLIPDIWRHIARHFLSYRALQKLGLINSKFLALYRSLAPSISYRMGFAREWEPKPVSKSVSHAVVVLFTLFSNPSVILTALDGYTHLKIFRFPCNTEYLTLNLGSKVHRHIACIKDDRFVLATDVGVVLFDAQGTSSRLVLATPNAYRIAVHHVSGICAISMHETVVIYSSDMEPLKELNCNKPSGVGISNDNILMVVSGGAQICTFDLETGQALRTLHDIHGLEIAVDAVGNIAVFSLFGAEILLVSKDGEHRRKVLSEGSKCGIVTAQGDLLCLSASQVIRFAAPE